MKNLVLLFLTFSLLVSCSTHQGMISSSVTDRNVIYSDIAFGTSETNKFFGIGGLSQDAMILEAKRKLVLNRPLKANEQYLNFTLDFKRTYWLIYFQTKVILSADVVKFTRDSLSDPYSDIYKNKISDKSVNNTLFSIGDTICDKNLSRGTIISNESSRVIRLLYKNRNDKIRIKKMSINDIFTLKKTWNGIKAGDWYGYSTSDVKGNEQPVAAKVVAVGIENLIIQDKDNNLIIVKYNK